MHLSVSLREVLFKHAIVVLGLARLNTIVGLLSTNCKDPRVLSSPLPALGSLQRCPHVHVSIIIIP